MALVGVLPPSLLEHLAQQNASVLSARGERVSVYRRGARLMVGSLAISPADYRDGEYRITPLLTSSNVGPLRRAARALEDARRRREERR